MMDKLKPCPFCGAGETVIIPNQNWVGMRWNVYSVTIRHHCNSRDIIKLTRNTEAEVITVWNQRANNGG
ncbi:hypothetical protein FE392_17920 [Xenorhabdus sp. 12]|uniref:Restriction alleviation protein, Lar family n=1 Tax=Xenorhabdus santafensis TaxID=2582833 RepID=A0ABU4SEF5_9GAMM|nr:Lar family restriction alleviation protein [Xenorhabdus sp. 12]MDX7989164.1 hypothetical protein [Xenorhabdus sp. 12]